MQRFDLFTTTHKSLRVMMNEIQHLAGSIDFNNSDEFTDFKLKFEFLWKVLHYHSEGEDKFIFPLLEKVDKKRFNLLDSTHHKLDPIMDELEEALKKIEEDNDRAGLGAKFYHGYNRFLSDYYMHIRDEEESLQIFWDNYDDKLLAGEYMKLPSVIPPEVSAYFANYLFRSVNKIEGWKFLENVKNNAPPTVFNMFMKSASDNMPVASLEFVKSKLE